jgi:hypothetical protein
MLNKFFGSLFRKYFFTPLLGILCLLPIQSLEGLAAASHNRIAYVYREGEGENSRSYLVIVDPTGENRVEIESKDSLYGDLRWSSDRTILRVFRSAHATDGSDSPIEWVDEYHPNGSFISTTQLPQLIDQTYTWVSNTIVGISGYLRASPSRGMYINGYDVTTGEAFVIIPPPYFDIHNRPFSISPNGEKFVFYHSEFEASYLILVNYDRELFPHEVLDIYNHRIPGAYTILHNPNNPSTKEIYLFPEIRVQWSRNSNIISASGNLIDITNPERVFGVDDRDCSDLALAHTSDTLLCLDSPWSLFQSDFEAQNRTLIYSLETSSALAISSPAWSQNDDMILVVEKTEGSSDSSEQVIKVLSRDGTLIASIPAFSSRSTTARITYLDW